MADAQPPSADTPKAAPLHVHELSPALGRALFGNAPPWAKDFGDLAYEWRRLFAEFVGTFLLVLVAAGAGVIDATSHGMIGRVPSVVAPALMVMAVILSVGAVSGAHLNPVVSVAFALRREFPWKRIAGYVLTQLAGAVAAVLTLWAMFGKAGSLGANLPGPHTSDLRAMVMEILLTFGLVTTILGTASGAQNVGPLSALAVAGYIALAGLWSSPVSGASMNPVRSLAPDLFNGRIGSVWIYLAGPTVGMLVAVAVAWVLRGPGGDATAAHAAQGSLGVLVVHERPSAHDGNEETER